MAATSDAELAGNPASSECTPASCKREGDAEFFVRLQCRTRHLFAISQRRITEQDSTATLVMADNSLTHFVDDGLGKLWEER